MDFKNLCQKIDVDGLRAKIPAMPALPALPQLKLPKSMPKIKSRRIFHTSRDNVNKDAATPKQQQQQHQQQQQQQQQHLALPQVVFPADFIDRTPTRISTISSLMQSHQHNESSTYRSACSINDDDYPSPTNAPMQQQQHCERISSRPISPVRMPRMMMINKSNNENTNAASLNSNDTSTPNPNVRLSLTEKLQKGYRDFSDFKFKHLFAKRTVVRKDNIEVDNYVQHYDDERLREEREQAQRDCLIKDNYRFKFKVSRQNTGHTNSISSNESRASSSEHNRDNKSGSRQQFGKSVSEQSGDESGMEATPTKHIRERFVLQTAAAAVEDDVAAVVLPHPEAMQSSLWSIKENRSPIQKTTPKLEPKSNSSKGQKISNKSRFISYLTSSQDETAGNESIVEVATGGVNMLAKIRNFGKRNDGVEAKAVSNNESGERKRKAPLTPQQSEEKTTTTGGGGGAQSVTERPLMAIKQNFKRFQKSMTRHPTTSASESENEDSPNKKTNKQATKTEKLAARLRSFRTHGSADELSKTSPKKDESNTKSSPRTAFTKKMQTWKQSLKKKESPTKNEAETHTGDESTPEKQQKRPGKLIKKLKHIRGTARKQFNSTEVADVVDEEPKKNSGASTRKSSNLEEKFVLARDRTMKKVNEKMHQMKFFHRSQDDGGAKPTNTNTPTKTITTTDDECEEDETKHKRHQNAPPNICRRGAIQPDDSPYDSEQDEIEEMARAEREYGTQRTRAAWTTKSILSDSLESDTDGEFPSVLIHQDNSDLFESTLIISVTRPASTSPSPRITEILPELDNSVTTASTKTGEWISNKKIISGFMNASPTGQTGNETRTHTRRKSMDSNPDTETWIPEKLVNKQQNNQSKENSRRSSTAGLLGVDEKEAPWKVQTTQREEKLYKTRSIDIFDANVKSGGASAAFEDFDDALKNTPIVRINARNTVSLEKDNSSDDADTADDDNSSRITKIMVKTIPEECEEARQMNLTPAKTHLETKTQLRQIGNSQESLIAHFNEEEDDDDDDSDDEDEDDRPPSAAPSPPPPMPSISPPPPPLPQRQPSIRLSKIMEKEATAAALPPLPITKPPLQQEPPQIPERTASMQRLAKPLVKTSSLRLAYNEQVKPADVGKVNKLISRFETPPPKTANRPRIIARKLEQDDSEDYSEEDEEDDVEDYKKSDDDSDDNNNEHFEHETTPTPTNIKNITRTNQKVTPTPAPTKMAVTAASATTTTTMTSTMTSTNTMSDLNSNNQNPTKILQRKRQQIPTIDLPIFLLDTDANLNLDSAASSEYGSPLKYTTDLLLSKETTPIQERKQLSAEAHGSSSGRHRRSVTNDDDNYYSFDSDEENSYYSISPSGSNRYIVEI